MEDLKFSIAINASKEKVWLVLWGEDTYPKWTRIFAEGSVAVTDWKEGSKVLFLDGKGSGMVSKIAASRVNEFMSFKHLGIIKNGVEDTDSDEVKSWGEALENYTLTEENGITDVTIEMGMTEDMKDYFIQTWPKALEELKKIAEQ